VNVAARLEAEARAAEAVDIPGMVEAIRRLVRIPSYGGRESPAQEFVAETMEAMGLSVDLWDIDLEDVYRHPACSWEIERDRGLGVVGSLSGGDGPTLILNGHVDVVPPGSPDSWTHPPFEGVLEGGRIHGRGSLDMKGPLMAGLFAMRAIRDAGITLDGTVHLQSVIGEEDGGLGTLAAILRGYRGDGAVVMEPTALAVAPVQAGCLNFRVRVPGRAAHGAVREEGVSAFDKMFLVYEALKGLERARNTNLDAAALFGALRTPFPISVGTMGGGDWASSVPDHAHFEGRMGVRPDESLDEARRSLEEAVKAVADADPFLTRQRPEVAWWGGRFLPAATPVEHRLVRTLREAFASTTGREAAVRGMPFGADAGLLQQVGETPVVLFGAGDIRGAHRSDECIDAEELASMARVLAAFIVRFCGA
jgi:acetylornithine deacetylase